MEKNKRETYRNASIFSLFTILSRFFGLIRDSLKAYAFGTGIYSVAFDIAFRIPNMLRNLVAEGALSHSFIPVYESYKNRNRLSEQQASGAVLSLIYISLSLFTLIAILLLPYILPYIMHGAPRENNLVEVTIRLSQILFPYILLMSASSIYMGIQYSHGIFGMASFGPALLNIVVIVFFGGYLLLHSTLVLEEQQEFLIYLFSYITLMAALAQLWFQKHTVTKAGLKPHYSLNFKHPAIKNLFTLMLPAVFGAAVQELGQLIDIYLATWISNEVPGAVSALTYAHRLIHLPMGIFGVAIATASLPQLSRIYKENNHKEFHNTLWTALGLNLFLILPSTIGLIIFSEPIIGLLFERGNFDYNSTVITSQALKYYAIGILGYSLQKLFMSSLYAQKNSRIPAIITFIVLLINILLSILFMKYLYHAGLALGSSLASYAGLFIYMFLLIKKGLFLFDKNKFMDQLKILIVNLILLFILYYVNKLLVNFDYGMKLLIAVPSGIMVYFLLSALFNVEEFKFYYNIIKHKIKRV